MRLGIIGAGQLAQAFAFRAIVAGHEVTLSNSRGPDSLHEVIARLGPRARAGTKYQAADSDTVVLAVPGDRVALALSGLGSWGGRTLVDATNHVSTPSPPLPGEMSSSALVADLAKGSNVIKALNTLLASVLITEPQPAPGQRRVIFMCGDNVPSKEAFRSLLEQIGYATIDLGGLAEGSRVQQFPGGPLAAVNLLRLG
jgi:8-hydroxy-5-deazaflavin:NADPH oxidoreductase